MRRSREEASSLEVLPGKTLFKAFATVSSGDAVEVSCSKAATALVSCLS